MSQVSRAERSERDGATATQLGRRGRITRRCAQPVFRGREIAGWHFRKHLVFCNRGKLPPGKGRSTCVRASANKPWALNRGEEARTEGQAEGPCAPRDGGGERASRGGETEGGIAEESWVFRCMQGTPVYVHRARRCVCASDLVFYIE